MLLEPSLVSFLDRVIATADQTGMTDVIIESGLIRAVNDERTAFIYHTDDVPSPLPFDAIGINRVDLFQSRLSLAKVTDGFQIDASIHDNFVRSLVLKGKGIKVEYRCANPKIIEQKRPPKRNIKATQQVVCELKISPELLSMIQKGLSAMQADFVRFVGNDQEVRLEIYDVNNDAFAYTIPNENVLMKSSFMLDFFAKQMLTILKKSSNGTFQMYDIKVLGTRVNDVDVFVTGKVE